MPDFIDQSDERQAVLEEARIANLRRHAQLEPGAPGECEYCGEQSPRLVRNACAPCRDKRKLP